MQIDVSAVPLTTHPQVITPTARLAFYLQKTQAHLGKIQSVSEWLTQLWDHYQQEYPTTCWRRISAWQSTIIWQQIIQQDELPLLRTHAVVQQVQQAWQILQQWQIPLVEIDRYLTQQTHDKQNDCMRFLVWAQQYQQICQQKKWIDDGQLPYFLATHIKKYPHHFHLYGFNYLTPQLNALCISLRKRGAKISEQQMPPTQEANIHYYCYADRQTEWRAAARWAKEQPGQTVGIVIPELAQYWAKIHRIFTEVLAPEQLIAGEPTQSKPFNLDAGLPFTQYPLIANSLLFLEWLAAPLPYAQVSHLIRTIFWPYHTEEFTARAQLMAELAAQNYQTLSLSLLVEFLRTDTQQRCILLQTLLEPLRNAYVQWTETARPSEWIKRIQELFVITHWAEEQRQCDQEQQIWQRWENALAEIATLDAIVEMPIRYATVLKLIQQHVQTICFQPESKLAKIQVMGILETAGMQFDHLWVCGLHAQSWPAAPQPNPFIPLSLQRRYQVPHSSYAQELIYAQQFTQQWKSATPHLIFSFAQGTSDTYFLPSPLFQHMVCVPKVEPTDTHPKPDGISSIAQDSRDDYGLACTEIIANASLLREQAECPFRAYANHRLGVARHKLTLPEPLGNAMRRGMVVHRALQLIWGVLQNHQRLIVIPAQELAQLVDEKVQESLQEHYQLLQTIMQVPAVFMQVEQQRLQKIVLTWLEKEKLRQPFHIHRLEQNVKLKLPGIILNMRVDRIDQIQDGTFVIVDYKTAKLPSMSFVSERLTHPQLPLYALSQREQLAAVVFAHVSGEQIGFSGWVENTYTEDLPRRSSYALQTVKFAEQLLTWQMQVMNLTQEYLQGYAAVKPYPDQSVCRICDLHLLCKIAN